jgi:predicted ATPase
MPVHLSVVAPLVAPPTQPLLGNIWHVRVLGGLEARSGDVTLKHFVSHPIAALLARLALQPQRFHPREELVELLWPGVGLDVGRNRLRNAISSLRRLLEPPGSPPGAVLIADRVGLRLAPGATRCDALEFERRVRERHFDDARSWYGGELLPGFYEDWVQDERARFAALLERAESAPIDVTEQAITSAAAGPITTARTSRALPGYLTGYFGREEEKLQLAAEVAEHRLVTLTGMGGAGKTRLAVEVARHITGFDLVGFAALADCANAAQSAAQLRVALQLTPASESLDSVVAFLLGAKPLLVLDNFEHLVAVDGVELVESLLQRLPDLHILVTSRRALLLPGEREFSLAPLPQPEPGSGLQSVARSPSVAMFVDRARNVRPDFQVTERNHEALAALCCALEGMPLAIELAASRSRAFTPKDMHAALAQRFVLLTRPGTRSGGVTLRHDSLRAAIDWSWQLLGVRQQRFLAALSVFRGGCTAASAQAVCGQDDARESLEELVADSLVRADLDAGGSMRFGMLEMIRDFLSEQLDADAARVLRVRHRARCLVLANAATAAVDEAELPNFHEAMRSGVDDGDAAFTLALALALRTRWERNGTDPEVLALLDRALSAAAVHDDIWVEGCVMTALLSLSGGKVAAAHRLADAALDNAAPNSAARAAALCARVRISSESLRHGDGLQLLLEEAMGIAELTNAIDIQAQCLGLMSMLALRRKLGPEKAEALADDARRLYQSIGCDREASALLYENTMCLLEMRFLPEALAQAKAFELESIALGDRHRQLKAINQQGVIQATMRRWADALDSYGRCVRLAWQMHNHYWLTFALWNHCRNLARLRDPERAALLMAFAERYWITHFGQLDSGDQRFVRQVRALVRRQVGAARLESLFREGVGLSIERAVALALSSRPAPDEATQGK